MESEKRLLKLRQMSFASRDGSEPNSRLSRKSRPMNRRTAAPDNGRWGHRCSPGDGHDLFKESRKYIEVFLYIYIHIQNNMCFCLCSYMW